MASQLQALPSSIEFGPPYVLLMNRDGSLIARDDSCCCNHPYNCSDFAHCLGHPGSSLYTSASLTFDGIVNNICVNCANYNTSFIRVLSTGDCCVFAGSTSSNTFACSNSDGSGMPVSDAPWIYIGSTGDGTDITQWLIYVFYMYIRTALGLIVGIHYWVTGATAADYIQQLCAGHSIILGSMGAGVGPIGSCSTLPTSIVTPASNCLVDGSTCVISLL